ncbi:hypothetical protein QQ045_000540 [Rhodiola kirilowii]
MNDYLLSYISEEEIRKAVLAQGPLKAPGIDGFPGILIMHQVPSHSKYLGLPLVMGQKKVDTFRCIFEKVWKRLNDWKCKLLSAAGREVLIKSVIQTLPVYTMSVYRLPEKTLQEIAKLISRFWWDKKENKDISWVNQGVLQLKKLDGRLGFRDLRSFNKAFLMKICWRIVKFPELLMSRLLVAKYCPDRTLDSAQVGSYPSHVWCGVIKVSPLFKTAIWWDADLETVRWKHASNGLFSVKSTYELIKQVEKSQDVQRGEQSDKRGLTNFGGGYGRVRSLIRSKFFVGYYIIIVFLMLRNY